MAKWQIGIVAGFLAVYTLTVVLTGNAQYVLVTAILAVLVLAYAGLNFAMRRRIEAQHGSVEDALSAEDEDIPSAHLIPDDSTAAGDTPEAHDEINPHDLPVDHRGRNEAERQAEGTGFTGGDADPAKAGRFDRGRTGAEGDVPEGDDPERGSAGPSTHPGDVTRPVS